MQVKKQQLEPYMEQVTVSKLGKEYNKAVYYHRAYLTYMQGTSCKMLGWMKHNLKSRLPGEISITSKYADDTIFMAESEEELKSPLMRMKEESEKAGLKLHIEKITSWHPVHHFMANRWGKSGSSDRFSLLGIQITVDSDCSHEI